jgi:hypothetical protein
VPAAFLDAFQTCSVPLTYPTGSVVWPAAGLAHRRQHRVEVRSAKIMLVEMYAEALFACDLQPSEQPTPLEVRRAVTATLCRYGRRWCAGRMAEEFGDHPETAVRRMAWAVRTVRECYPARP